MAQKKLLFVDCCISNHASRTKKLCNDFLMEFKKKNDVIVETVIINAGSVSSFTGEQLDRRDGFIAQNDYSNEMFNMARQFALADYIVIGAPYWDLSFPSLLKVYIENIMVNGLTFCYAETGMKGLCLAEKLYYITTAGGYILQDYNMGYDYIKAISYVLGIKEAK